MPIYLTRRLKCHSARGLGWRIEVRWRRGYRDVDGDEDEDTGGRQLLPVWELWMPSTTWPLSAGESRRFSATLCCHYALIKMSNKFKCWKHDFSLLATRCECMGVPHVRCGLQFRGHGDSPCRTALHSCCWVIYNLYAFVGANFELCWTAHVVVWQWEYWNCV